MFVALPIRARYLHELNVFDLAGARKVRAAAQVYEVALTVKCDLAAGGQFFDKLHFVDFVKSLHLRHCLFARNGYTLYGQIRRDYFFHFVFDSIKQVYNKRMSFRFRPPRDRP